MQTTSAGDLVTVTDGGPALDGIVFETPSRTKVVVAVVQAGRGAVLRTVHPRTLAERVGEGPDDRALRLLIRRTPAPARGAARGGVAAGRGQAGHARGTAHRPTGR